MNNFYVVIEESHPLKELILKKKIPRGPGPSSCPRDHILVDLRILSLEDRLDDLEGFPGPVICDGTSGFLKASIVANKNIRALIPLAFYSPTCIYEVLVNNEKQDENKLFATEFLKKLDFTPYFVADNLDYSFILPRMGAMLINEFFFAKEQILATSHDMDQALKFGVNYPLGADEWKNKSSLEALAYLMQLLAAQKNPGRYEMAHGLLEQL